MVKFVPRTLDSVFSALANPIRRSVVERLARGEASVTELSTSHTVSAPSVSRHLRVLEEAGLIERRRRGRVRYCRLRREPLNQLQLWMAEQHALWEGTLTRLEEHLSTPDVESSADEKAESLAPKLEKRYSKSDVPMKRRRRRSSKPGPIPNS